ncbi:MAG TPA: response regulator transcription factor [Anaerolineales bacterium]|nr:response regulator transcription factor [Anaerolineales bacterium]
MGTTILVVDDEEHVLSLLKAYLTQQGFRVVTAPDGREALEVARKEKPGLILLDVMMPEMDGIEFLRRHRKEHTTPVILLTARIEESDKVVGLELGADDYVTKPFSPRELVARVRAVLRRAGRDAPRLELLVSGGVSLNRKKRRVMVDDKLVDLTPSEFELLACLMSAPGKVFTRFELLDHLHGMAFEGYERSIDLHIKNLRAKIESEPRRPRYVETVYGVGYRFADEEGE